MKNCQKYFYKTTLLFSVTINFFILGILFFVVKDSLSGYGDYLIVGKKLLYFILIVFIYSLFNVYSVYQYFNKKTDDNETKKQS